MNCAAPRGRLPSAPAPPSSDAAVTVLGQSAVRRAPRAPRLRRPARRAYVWARGRRRWRRRPRLRAAPSRAAEISRGQSCVPTPEKRHELVFARRRGVQIHTRVCLLVVGSTHPARTTRSPYTSKRIPQARAAETSRFWEIRNRLLSGRSQRAQRDFRSAARTAQWADRVMLVAEACPAWMTMPMASPSPSPR